MVYLSGLRPRPFSKRVPHPQAGHFRFGESAQSHSTEARVAEAATALRASLTAEPHSRHIRVPVARARHAAFVPDGLILRAPVLGARYGYKNSVLVGADDANQPRFEIVQIRPQPQSNLNPTYRARPRRRRVLRLAVAGPVGHTGADGGMRRDSARVQDVVR